MIWDKPHVYGPLLHLFHWRISLWGPVLAQGLMLSHLLWLAQRALRGQATPGVHLLACAAAAALTTAPFTIALLMPDVFAPAVLLALLLLGFARDRLSRGEALWLGLVAAIGIAAHLSHLPLAAAVAVLVALVARRVGPVLRVVAPVMVAVVILAGSNAWLHGRAALSPHGATFALARLQADGPAAAVIRDRCPESGWYLCAFADRLPMDSDAFLWDADSPVNRAADGTPRFLGGAMLSAEAGAIVGETLRTRPVEVARAMIGNTLRQFTLALAGDTLVDSHLAAAVRPRIAEAFPAGELATYDGALQPGGVPGARPFLWPHAPVLLLGRSSPAGLVAGGEGGGGPPARPGARRAGGCLRQRLRHRRPVQAASALRGANPLADAGHRRAGIAAEAPRLPPPWSPGVTALLAVLLGAAMLVWPAGLNHYPLVFIDTVPTHAHHRARCCPGTRPRAYGPFLHCPLERSLGARWRRRG